jgi:hypothetical protein
MKEKVRKEEVASENLSKYRVKEDYDNYCGKATVRDINTEFNGNIIAEFKLKLPDGSTGYLRFPESKESLLRTFIQEDLYTCYSDMNVMYKDVLVFKSNNTGWCARIGNKRLRYTCNKESWFFNLNSLGTPIANRYIRFIWFCSLFIPIIKPELVFIVLCIVFLTFFVYRPLVRSMSPYSHSIETWSATENP